LQAVAVVQLVVAALAAAVAVVLADIKHPQVQVAVDLQLSLL
jgi:hypothetical protein